MRKRVTVGDFDAEIERCFYDKSRVRLAIKGGINDRTIRCYDLTLAEIAELGARIQLAAIEAMGGEAE